MDPRIIPDGHHQTALTEATEPMAILLALLEVEVAKEQVQTVMEIMVLMEREEQDVLLEGMAETEEVIRLTGLRVPPQVALGVEGAEVLLGMISEVEVEVEPIPTIQRLNKLLMPSVQYILEGVLRLEVEVEVEPRQAGAAQMAPEDLVAVAMAQVELRAPHKEEEAQQLVAMGLLAVQEEGLF